MTTTEAASTSFERTMAVTELREMMFDYLNQPQLPTTARDVSVHTSQVSTFGRTCRTIREYTKDYLLRKPSKVLLLGDTHPVWSLLTVSSSKLSLTAKQKSLLFHLQDTATIVIPGGYIGSWSGSVSELNEIKLTVRTIAVMPSLMRPGLSRFVLDARIPCYGVSSGETGGVRGEGIVAQAWTLWKPVMDAGLTLSLCGMREGGYPWTKSLTARDEEFYTLANGSDGVATEDA